MSQIRIERVLTLPTERTGSTIYIVKSATAGLAEIYFTNTDGSETVHVIDKSDIAQMIAEAGGGGGALNNIKVVQTIAERDALELTETALVLVLDATGDNTVTTGAALYVWDAATTQYYKVSEFESLDVVLDWGNIQNRPNSSPSAIDDAVDKAHTHANKSTLDKFGEDEDGLTFNGEPLPIALSKAEW